MKVFKVILIWVTVWSIPFIALGQNSQNKINSPYSAYGMGNLKGRNVNIVEQGMGGLSIGYSNPLYINPNNAASMAVYDSMHFIFETGIKGELGKLSSLNDSENSSSFTLSYFLMGFPVTKWWGSSLGLLPYSEIGYNIDVSVDMSQYDFGDIIYNIEGNGRFNQFYWGNGFKITKNLRAGVNASVLFGNPTFSKLIFFPDSMFILNTRTVKEFHMVDILFDFGLQYDLHLKNNNKITFGVIYQPTLNASTRREELSKTLSGGYIDVDYDKDTIYYHPETKGDVVIPYRLGGGLTYYKGNLWMVGADFEFQKWEDFSVFGISDSISNSWTARVGGQFSPKHTVLSPLYKKIVYRMGAHYGLTYLKLNGHQLSEFGISVGATFPIRKSRSTFSLAMEYGGRGTVQYGLLRENFVNFTFGLSINQLWFVKRRYQ
jgi:hypothetical protein